MTERTRALVQVENQSGSQRVRAETLIDYLISGDLAHANEFASELNLSRFKQLMLKLKNESVSTDVHNKRQKKLLKKFVKRYKFTVNKERTPEIIQLQAQAERHSCIYYDPETHNLNHTEIFHGEYESVNSGKQVSEILRNKKVPLIDIHTHPDNSPFSFNDYIGALIRGFHKRGRLCPASIVVCPDIQILAMPSKETPEFSILRVGKYVNRADKARNKNIENRTKKLDMLCLRLMDRIEQNRKETTRKVNKRSKKLTEAEIKFLASEPESFKNQLLADFDKELQIDENLNIRFQRALNKATTAGNRVMNNELIGFARDHNIKLYLSTDMEHFKAFSA